LTAISAHGFDDCIDRPRHLAKEAAMKGSLVIAGCCAAVLSAGCGELASPGAPSAIRPDATSLRTTGSGGHSLNASALTSHAGGAVPFKGSLDGQYGTPAGAFPLIHESIVATGHATHLGSYTLRIDETVNLLEASATGTFTFTAANGDTVFGTFTGHAQLGPLVSIVEDASVLGGTGRFAGAEGSFSIDRVFDPVKRTTTGSFEGAISSPGAGTN
jgi:hypothetical protein